MKRSSFKIALFASVFLAGGLFVSGAALRVAVLDFALAESPGNIDPVVTDFSQAVQARLLTTPDYEWVERQELNRVVQESDQAGLGRMDAATAVRLGHLARADLLLRGEIVPTAPGAGELQLEVVDMKHADVLSSQKVKLDLSNRKRLRVDSTTIKAVVAAATTALNEARIQSERHEQRLLAPLYFKNIGRTDRLNFVEGKLFEALATAAVPATGVRVLQFPRSGTASEEASLVLGGLTDSDPDAWQHVADAYTWGTLQEQASDGVSFEDTPIQIDVQVWPGAGEPHAVHWQGLVKELSTGLQTVSTGVFEKIRIAANTRDNSERGRIASFLKQRADETQTLIQRSNNSQGFLQSDTGRQLYAYRLHLLETACFFDPLNQPLQAERLSATWVDSNPATPLAYLRGHWQRLADYEQQARQFERRPDGSINPSWRRQRTARLMELVQALDRAPWDAIGTKTTSEDLQRQRQAAFAWWAATVIAANQPAGTGVANATAEDNERWRNDLMELLDQAGDPVTARDLVDQTLPVLQKAIGKFLKDPRQTPAQKLFIDRLYSIYDSFGEFDRVRAMLDTAWKLGTAPLPNSGQPIPARPRVDRPWKVSLSPQEQMRRMMPPDPATAEIPNLEIVTRELEYWPVGTYFRANPEERIPEKNLGHFIDALAWHEGQLWIAESLARPLPPENGPANPQSHSYLWRYDPMLHTAENVSAQMGGHSAVHDLVPSGNDMWLVLDTDGIWRRTTRGEIKHFKTEDGLASPREFAGQTARNAFFFIGGTPPAYAISHYDSGTDKWSVIQVPESGSVFPPGMNPILGVNRNSPAANLPQLAVCGDWVCVASPVASLYNTATKTWTKVPLPPLPPPTLPPNIKVKIAPPFADAPVALSLVTADEHAFWLGQPGRLLFLDPNAPEGKKYLQLPGTPIGAAHHGPWLWLAVDDGLNGTRVALIDKRSTTCVGLSNRMEGRMSKVAATDNRLWLGGQGLYEVELKEPRISGESDGPVSPDHPLLRAVWNGDSTRTEELLAGKTNINDTSASGWSALMIAAESGNTALVQLLLENGANPNLLTVDGRSALTLALDQPDAALAEQLLKSHADADLHLPVRIQGLDARSLTRDMAAPPEIKQMPAQPTDLKVTFEADGRAVLSWQEHATSPGVRYQVTRNRSVFVDLPSGVCHTTDINVPWGEAEITYSVLALNASGYWEKDYDFKALEAKVKLPTRPKYLVVVPPRGNLETTSLPVSTLAKPPLVAAAGRGRMDLVKLLLDHRANVEATDGLGNTAFLAAVRNGKYDVARTLLVAGAKPDATTEGYQSPANLAYRRHDDEEFVRNLMAALPPTTRVTEASSMMLDAARNGQIKDLELLRELGGALSAFNDTGESALSRAIAADQLDTIAWILDRQPPLHQILRGGFGKLDSDQMILQNAVSFSRPQIVARLLAMGCSPDTKDDHGTPLTILAARRKALEILRVLLEAKADPQQVASNDSRKLVDYLTPAEAQALLGATTSATWPLPSGRHGWKRPWTQPRQPEEPVKQPLTEQLIVACKKGDLAAAVAAMQSGVNLDQLGEDGRNPLHHSLIAQHPEIARRLIEEGASVNVTSRGGNTPLNFAIQNGNQLGMIDYLLQAGADPNAYSFDSYPALFSAVISNNHAAVKRLLDSSAKVNLVGNNDSKQLVSPLGMALRHSDEEVVDWLLAAGANPRVQNYGFVQTDNGVRQYNQASLLMYAAGGKNVGLVKRMIGFGQNPRFKDDDGEDALSWAATVGGKDVVEYLLPLSEKRGRGLEHARQRGHIEIVQLLEQAGYQNIDHP